MTKTCSKCGIQKNIKEFYKRTEGGYKSWCINCLKIHYQKNKEKKKLQHKEYYKNNNIEIKNQHRQYYQNNKKQIKESRKQYYETNKEKIKEYKKQHWEHNKDKIKQYREKNKEHYKQYREINKDKILAYKQKWVSENQEHVVSQRQDYYQRNKLEIYKWVNNRKKNNPSFKIRCNLSCRIYLSLKHQSIKKQNNTTKLVGCTIDELKIHLEKQFKEGMTWENQGIKGWCIDHIIPCILFDLTKEGEQLKCFNYRNLRPCWKIENIIKADKLDYDLIEKHNIFDLLPEQIQSEGLRYEA